MKTYVHILWYLVELSLECEIFPTRVVEEITHVLCSIVFFSENRAI